MKILSTSDQDIERAAAALAAGKLVAFPTETVYGLGGDAFNLSALAGIFEAKNRPRFDPLIIHIAEPDALFRIVDTASLDKTAGERLSLLSEQLWPGPLTLILPKRPEVPGLATAGLTTAAVRFPSHLVAQKLIRLSTGAVAAPSANPFGCLSPTRPEHVKAQLGDKVDFIIDGGKTQVGVESTVLDLSHGPPRILRPGGTSRETIEALIGPVEIVAGVADSKSPLADMNETQPKIATQALAAAPLSPGQLKSHYAPRTPLILCKQGELAALPVALDSVRDEGRLYFSPPKNTKNSAVDRMGIPDKHVCVLSETGDMAEAAANLFDMLHELDSLGLRLIRAEEAPGFGLGEAINDRLRRATAPKTP